MKVQLPIKGKVFQNVDDIELVGNLSPYLMDGSVDDMLCVRRRPGLDLWVDLGTGAPIDGLYWNPVFNCMFAVSNGHMFKISDIAGTNADVTVDTLNAGTRVSFAHDLTYQLAANGGRIVYYLNVGMTTYIADADAPTTVTQLAFLDNYILADSINTGRFYWCDVGDPSSWNAASYATAEAKADNLTALRTSIDEIFLGGNLSLEVWGNDGLTPFSRLQGSAIDRGVSAKYSMVDADNSWFFIDNESKFVRLSGRTAKAVSSCFDTLWSTFSGVSSVQANHISIGSNDFITLHFTNEARTFVYDIKHDDWSEWAYWNSVAATYEDFLCRTYTYSPAWNMHVMGSRIDGKLYTLSSTVYDDNSNPIRTARRTAHLDHGTNEEKRCNGITIKMKRGVGIAGSADTPYVMMRFRDDGSSIWSNEYWISLGLVGATEWLGWLMQPLGTYRSRQWEFVVSDAVPFTLISVEEDVDILGV